MENYNWNVLLCLQVLLEKALNYTYFKHTSFIYCSHLRPELMVTPKHLTDVTCLGICLYWHYSLYMYILALPLWRLKYATFQIIISRSTWTEPITCNVTADKLKVPLNSATKLHATKLHRVLDPLHAIYCMQFYFKQVTCLKRVI